MTSIYSLRITQNWTIKRSFDFFERREILRHWTINDLLVFERRETLRHWTINDLLVFERRETLRQWTINDLLGWSTKAGLLLLRILNCDEEIRPT